jgi:Uma2 family endonuclease
MTTIPTLMTAAQLAELPRGRQRHGLIAGELRTMPLNGAQHGQIAARMAISLGTYVLDHRLGVVLGTGIGFLLARHPDTVRAPDVAFVRQARVDEVGRTSDYWPGPPDLAVEVVSPSDRPAEVAKKVAAWLAAGSALVLVVDPRRRTVAVHAGDAPVRLLTGADMLESGAVVPGWSLPVAALFAG